MNKTISIVLKAVALAMGVATFVLNILNRLEMKDGFTFISLAIIGISVSLLPKNK